MKVLSAFWVRWDHSRSLCQCPETRCSLLFLFPYSREKIHVEISLGAELLWQGGRTHICKMKLFLSILMWLLSVLYSSRVLKLFNLILEFHKCIRVFIVIKLVLLWEDEGWNFLICYLADVIPTSLTQFLLSKSEQSKRNVCGKIKWCLIYFIILCHQR